MRHAIQIAILAVMATRAYGWFPQWSARIAFATPADRTLVVADMNGDGRDDAMIRTATHQLLLATSNSDATLTAPVVIYQGDYLTDALAGEVTNDDKTDLIVSDTATNRIITLPSNGDTTFGTPILSPLTLAPTQLASGDFNGDGKLDLAVRSYSASALAILAGDGTGHFAEISRFEIASSAYRIATGDADADGHTDVLIAHQDPWQHEVLFGRGDGTFAAPLVLAAPAASAGRIAFADLDHDGDAEIVSCEFDPATLTVSMNEGSRTFAAATTYVVLANSTSGDAFSFAVGDVNEDGHADVVVTLSNARMLATLCGNGTGALGAPAYSYAFASGYSTFPHYVALTDLNGDSRPDLIATAQGQICSFRNAAGDVDIVTNLAHPTISVGQNADVTVDVRTARGYVYPSSFVPPFPAGLVSLRDDASEVAAPVTPQNRQATFELTSLPAGDYRLTAGFAGDAEYHAAAAAPVIQRVVNEQTTVTLTSSVGDASVAWPERWTLTADVTSPLAEPLNGDLWLYTDGVKAQYPSAGPRAGFSMPTSSYLSPGEHDFRVVFDGTASQPPSSSPIYRKLVTKARTTLRFGTTGGYTVRYGQQPELRVEIFDDPHSGTTPSGIVRILDGATQIHSMDGGGLFNVPVLSVGVHYLTAVFEGSNLWEGSRSTLLRYEVVPATGFIVRAISSGTNIQVEGMLSPAAYSYTIYERVGSGTWTIVSRGAAWASFSRSDAQPGTVYSYRMEAYDSRGQFIASSNTDMTMALTFTDAPLAPGVFVKAVHLQEIVSATNAMRSQCSLSPIGLANHGVGQPILAAHIAQLRNAIAEARSRLGVGMPAYSSGLSAGAPLLAQHVEELRDALR